MAKEVEVGGVVAKLRIDRRDWQTNLASAQNDLQSFIKSADKMAHELAKTGRRLTLAITAPVVGMATVATKSFADFEVGMRNVNVIAKESESQFKKTGNEALKLAQELGRDPVELTKALYDINSASFIGAQGLEVLRAAAYAARAGLATTDQAAKAITAVLNAYGLSASAATDVSDILFKTVEKGVVTFEQLSEELGVVVATGAASGVQFEEIAAAAATMTRGGIKANEAFTSLNRMLLRLITGSEGLDKLFATTEAGSANAHLAMYGLGETMRVISEHTRGFTSELTKLGFMVRDLKASQSLTRNEMQDFARDLGLIANKAERTGATVAAFKEQTKSLAFQLDRFKTVVKVAAIELGEVLAPHVRKMIDFVGKLVLMFSGLDPKVKSLIVVIAAMAAAIGPVLLSLGMVSLTLLSILKLASGIATAIKMAFAGAAIVKFLMFTLAAGAAIGGLLVYLVNTWETWRKIGIEIYNTGKAFLEWSGLDYLFAPIMKLFDAIPGLRAAIKTLFTEITAEGATLEEKFKNFFGSIKKVLKAFLEDAERNWRGWIEGAIVGVRTFGAAFSFTFGQIATVLDGVALNFGVFFDNFYLNARVVVGKVAKAFIDGFLLISKVGTALFSAIKAAWESWKNFDEPLSAKKILEDFKKEFQRSAAEVEDFFKKTVFNYDEIEADANKSFTALNKDFVDITKQLKSNGELFRLEMQRILNNAFQLPVFSFDWGGSQAEGKSRINWVDELGEIKEKADKASESMKTFGAAVKGAVSDVDYRTKLQAFIDDLHGLNDVGEKAKKAEWVTQPNVKGGWFGGLVTFMESMFGGQTLNKQSIMEMWTGARGVQDTANLIGGLLGIDTGFLKGQMFLPTQESQIVQGVVSQVLRQFAKEGSVANWRDDEEKAFRESLIKAEKEREPTTDEKFRASLLGDNKAGLEALGGRTISDVSVSALQEIAAATSGTKEQLAQLYSLISQREPAMFEVESLP